MGTEERGLTDLGPAARVDELSAETAPGVVYQRFLAEGTLAYQRCDACQRAIFHPRVLCRYCGSDELHWQRSEGLGTVYASTQLHPRDEDPYNVSLIDMDEGFRMMSNVVDVPASQVRIGERVRVDVREGADGMLPQFVVEQA